MQRQQNLLIKTINIINHDFYVCIKKNLPLIDTSIRNIYENKLLQNSVLNQNINQLTEEKYVK